MQVFSMVAVGVTNLFIGARYFVLIRRQRIKPALAMWVFFTIAVCGSLATYLSEGDYSLMDNALNTMDILLVSFVVVVILIYGDRSTKFSRFDVGCFVAVVAILVAWVFTRQHAAAHIAIQAILVIAYIPVVKRMGTSQQNTESFGAWIGLLLAPIFSLLASRGSLATLYAVRTIVCSSALLVLMIRLEWKVRSLAARGQGK